jgi:hypothetical protein
VEALCDTWRRDVAQFSVTHPPECPDCGARLSATTDAGFETVGGGASGVALVQVRCANQAARYRTEAVRGAVVTYPTRCGCGALWALAVAGAEFRLEIDDRVEWGDGWPDA